mmetsp:Transcript_18681/g.42751  ORF Transcript_18681/g.42751 Transcript_18681/m.42751 type:complete len:428 (+) Transcript_18681:1286-2569(+)|eukprot:733296-Hanusia_phi.AAC.4
MSGAVPSPAAVRSILRQPRAAYAAVYSQVPIPTHALPRPQAHPPTQAGEQDRAAAATRSDGDPERRSSGIVLAYLDIEGVAADFSHRVGQGVHAMVARAHLAAQPLLGGQGGPRLRDDLEVHLNQLLLLCRRAGAAVGLDHDPLAVCPSFASIRRRQGRALVLAARAHDLLQRPAGCHVLVQLVHQLEMQLLLLSRLRPSRPQPRDDAVGGVEPGRSDDRRVRPLLETPAVDAHLDVQRDFLGRRLAARPGDLKGNHHYSIHNLERSVVVDVVTAQPDDPWDLPGRGAGVVSWFMVDGDLRDVVEPEAAPVVRAGDVVPVRVPQVQAERHRRPVEHCAAPELACHHSAMLRGQLARQDFDQESSVVHQVLVFPHENGQAVVACGRDCVREVVHPSLAAHKLSENRPANLSLTVGVTFVRPSHPPIVS